MNKLQRPKKWILYVEQKRPMLDVFLPQVLVNIVMEYLMDDVEEPFATKNVCSVAFQDLIIRCCRLSMHMLFLRLDRTETFFVKQIVHSLNSLSAFHEDLDNITLDS
jgi:hypothetical protein